MHIGIVKAMQTNPIRKNNFEYRQINPPYSKKSLPQQKEKRHANEQSIHTAFCFQFIDQQQR